jgi:hypothetical protein
MLCPAVSTLLHLSSMPRQGGIGECHCKDQLEICFFWLSLCHLLFAGKARGFGFAGFMCRAHAERAIKLANAKVGGVDLI